MKKTILSLAITIALLGGFSAAIGQTVKQLTPLVSFGANFDGSIQPPAFDPYPPMDTGNNQRGLAYDAVSGRLVLVNTSSGSGGSSDVLGSIIILDATYGTNISTLNTNGMISGNYVDASAGVADDGVVYVANLVNSSTSLGFKIYRWDSVNSADPPYVCFSNTIAPTQRYGTSLDVRGSGANTQIIIGSSPQQGGSGTNVVIFTTSDGTNFTPTVLATDAVTANFTDGIAFGTGDTFWAKRLDSPLRLMSFNLGTATATTLKTYDTTTLPATAKLGPIAVDTANNLLAAIEVISGSEKVWLFDISSADRGPVLLDIKSYTPDNTGASAPPGYLTFGGNNLYTHVINNGLLAFQISSLSAAAPAFLVSPPAAARIVSGQSLTLNALAHPDARYQWQRYGAVSFTNLPNATNLVYTIATATTNEAGRYRVLASNSAGSTPSSECVVSVVNLADLWHLNLQWSAKAGDPNYPFITYGGSAGTPNQRTMAYNALSNHLYVVSRAAPTGNSSSNYTVYVVNAGNGQVLYTLNTNAIPNWVPSLGGANGVALVAIGVAEDGAVYISNMSPDSAAASDGDTNRYFRVWRWANANSNTVPVKIFEGDPAGQPSDFRWGDVMAVRGAGANTQLLFDNTDADSRFISVLRPTDETMTTWTAQHNFLSSPHGSARIGRSLEFGAGDTLWQKRGFPSSTNGPLVQSSFDVTGPNVTATLNVYNNFPARLCGVGMDATRKLVAGVNIPGSGTVDYLELYDIQDLNNPLLIQQVGFPSPRNGNNNYITQTMFSGNKLFTLDANNGIMVFTVVSGPPEPPQFLTQPQGATLVENLSYTMTVSLDQSANLQWQKEGVNLPGQTNASFTITGAQLTNAGNYRVVATNFYGGRTSDVAVISVKPLTGYYHLSQIWSLAPQSRPYLPADGDAQGQTPLYRSLAYNALSNHIYIVSRITQTEGLTINVLDATTGADLYQLNTNGIAGGTIVLLAIDVADDGAIYAANMSSTTPAVYQLYRWANAAPTTAPVLVFSGEPANQTGSLRWGDVIDVRGAGMNTEVVIDTWQGTFGAVLKPSDASMNTFTNGYFSEIGPSAPIGRSIQFSSGNTIWQKRRGWPLTLSSYNLEANSSATLNTYNTLNSLGPVALDPSRNLLAGLNISDLATGTPDTVSLYEVSDLNQPLLIAKYPFPVNNLRNNNYIGQVVFAGNRVYALNANNGILAFDIIPPAAPELKVAVDGSNMLVAWPATFSGYTLYWTADLASPSWASLGTGSVVGTNYVVTNGISGGSKFYRLEQ